MAGCASERLAGTIAAPVLISLLHVLRWVSAAATAASTVYCLITAFAGVSFRRRRWNGPPRETSLPMLIASYSGIPYREFLWRLGPVALAGLFLDWAILYGLFRHQLRESATPPQAKLPEVRLIGIWKPALVMTAVIAGFLAGAPPALAAALGAAALLISRNTDPHKLYGEVDWGLLVFFVGLFLIVGGAENAGIIGKFLLASRYVNLHQPAVFSVATAALSNLVSNVPAVMLLKSLVPAFPNPHSVWLLLAMASTLAGNLTITGSVANIIVVETSKPVMTYYLPPNPVQDAKNASGGSYHSDGRILVVFLN